MLPVLLALLVQSSTISGSLISPQGSATPESAQVVLLPSEYALIFNAEAQLRIDNYWNSYKQEFAQRKEAFSQAFALAYREALETTLSRMRSDGKDNGTLIRTATAGRFEFRGVPPGDYRIVVTAQGQSTTYVWTESLHVTTAAPIFIQMKTRVP